MRTLLANGTVVTATEVAAADVLVEGERVAAVGPALSSAVDRIIDVGGCYLLPGAVDAHTHLDLPVGDVVSADDFASGTIAAACGGTTTIIDFATQQRGGTLGEALDAWHRRARDKAAVDYGFHVTVCDVHAGILDEMDALVLEGITSFKVFMAYPDRLQLDDAGIYRILRRSSGNGALVQVHAENGTVIDLLVREAVAAGRTAPRFHAETRPPVLEEEAVRRAIALAELAGAPLYVVHVSTAGAVDAMSAARARHLRIYGETCPQYLFLSEEAYEAPGLEGARFVMSPPLRPASMQPRLWEALARGELQVVATDHCPFSEADKARGEHDFSRIPSGGPGIETRLPLLFEGGVRTGRLSLTRFVDVVATEPARIFGLYPRKGTVAVGSDADLVAFDPRARQTLSADTHHMRVDYSLYEGMEVTGVVRTVLLRGEVIVDQGRFVGRAGGGRFLPRAPHH